MEAPHPPSLMFVWGHPELRCRKLLQELLEARSVLPAHCGTLIIVTNADLETRNDCETFSAERHYVGNLCGTRTDGEKSDAEGCPCSDPNNSAIENESTKIVSGGGTVTGAVRNDGGTGNDSVRIGIERSRTKK